MNRLHTYILKETLPPVILGILLFTLLVISQQLVKISDYIITGGVPPSEIAKLLIFSLPAFLEISIPVSMILGVTYAFSRLSIDSEIIALRASGISVTQLLLPVCLLSLSGFAGISYISLYGSAAGYNNLYSTLRKISYFGTREIIKEGVFTRLTPTTLVYVDHMSPDGKKMKGIVISEKRALDEPIIIAASEGRKSGGGTQKESRLHLSKGIMIQKMKGEDIHRIVTFGEMTLQGEEKKAVSSAASRKPKEISVPELIRILSSGAIRKDQTPSYLFSLNKRLSLPFACLIFPFLAVPLGLAQRSRSKSASFIITAGTVFIYYLFLAVGQSVKSFSPHLAIAILWLPNLLFGILTLYVIRKLDMDALFGEKFRKLTWRRK